MKYAVIDTETSGLFDFSKPADAEGQPRLASLAMILLNENLETEQTYDIFIKPDGWSMNSGATAVNGLTNDFLNKNGISVKSALDIYSRIIEDGYAIVAFNAQFDTKVMRGEMRRANIPDQFETTPNICVMRAATDIVKSPKKSGSGYKFPKLSEACAFFKIEQSAEHSALDDAIAAMQIFRALKKMGACPDPEVHYAKNMPEPIKNTVIPDPIVHERSPIQPIEGTLIGDNMPPSPIDFAGETMETISAWMETHPVIQIEDDARKAKLLIDRAKAALEAIEAERDAKVRPLNDQVSAINLQYKFVHNSDAKKPGLFDKIFNELKSRLAVFLKAEEDKRIEAARVAYIEAQKAADAAREAERVEREAIENAKFGEVGASIADVTLEADIAFKTFEKASRAAEIAERDTRFKIGGGFTKSLGLRTNKVLALTDWEAAIKEIGLTEKIREAVLSSARDYRKLRDRLPAGVTETEDRVL